jgi:hypothetical protein
MQLRAATVWIGKVAIATALIACCAHVVAVAQRPDLTTAKPLATSKLQIVAAAEPSGAMLAANEVYTTQPATSGLINYLRTARGEWQIPASVDRDDPWNRLLLLSPKRPLVIDVAVFIDGKPYRAAREIWIDEALAGKPNDRDSSIKSREVSDKVLDSVETGEKKPPADGTSQTVEASKGQPGQAAPKIPEASEEQKEKKELPAAPAVPLVAVQRRHTPAIRERLRKYLATVGASVSRDEIRWLLAEWGSGPPLILLGPSLSWERATTAPLLAYLDKNKDGQLDKSEVAAVESHLTKADADANGVVEISEVRRADSRPLTTPYPTGHPLLVALDESTNWQSLSNEFSRLYGQKATAAFANDVRSLSDQTADVAIRVDFGTSEGQASGISVIAVGPKLSQRQNAIDSTEDVITLDIESDYVEFSAQSLLPDSAEAGGSQIAIGAIVDGDPLLRVIDRDQDGKLTSREREQLASFIRGLDRNGDGNASNDEIPIPIRLAVTHGPAVDQLLATSKPAARIAKSAPIATVAAPDWFVSADKNKDGDWSPDEFLGTPEQFRQFDTDGDRRISVMEAVAAAK